MNIKLFLVFSLFVFQCSFSQTAKPLKGSVSYDGFLLQNVDVINKTSKLVAKTNDKGEFVIDAKVNDSLFFYRKNFQIKRLKISHVQLEQSSLSVLMDVKPEELDEVVVERVESMSLKGSKGYEQSKLDEYKTEKFDNKEGHDAMRDGTFVNGLNFVNIFKKISGLFAKEKDSQKEAASGIEFATAAKKICDKEFFTQNLKLKPDEIDLFLQFCNSDPKSKMLDENTDVLSMMDFLIIKNKEFQKLKKEVVK
jgi:hypothetical protein